METRTLGFIVIATVGLISISLVMIHLIDKGASLEEYDRLNSECNERITTCNAQLSYCAQCLNFQEDQFLNLSLPRCVCDE